LPYVLAQRHELSGPEGAPIAIEAVADTVGEKLRQRLQTRELLLHSPPSEPSTPAPELPHGAANVPL